MAPKRHFSIYDETVEMMGWLLLEAGVALFLLILIVWFTLPKKTKKDDEQK
ncbi:MAG: hypothetical protein IV108_11305 [Burkholderiales bacterium]|nr:hypothetical protein [Burkholderiales bacterium]